MVRIFKTIDGAIHEIQEPQEGCWIALTNPTATEIFEISEQFGIEVDDLRAPLYRSGGQLYPYPCRCTCD